ncbi:MAG: DUF305 domain-containing protein [Mycobacterium sp.]|nr:DUF305 domain-containing protein [Mycobacterium sp.]
MRKRALTAGVAAVAAVVSMAACGLRVVDLANQIKPAQGAEIQQMQACLAKWRQPVPPSTSTMPDTGVTPQRLDDGLTAEIGLAGRAFGR